MPSAAATRDLQQSLQQNPIDNVQLSGQFAPAVTLGFGGFLYARIFGGTVGTNPTTGQPSLSISSQTYVNTGVSSTAPNAFATANTVLQTMLDDIVGYSPIG